MPETRRRYDRDFKIETIRLVKEQGRNVADLAIEIGIHENTIYKWLKEYAGDQENAFPGCGNLKPEMDEVQRLKRQVANLQEENEILKKAMAIFTRRPR